MSSSPAAPAPEISSAASTSLTASRKSEEDSYVPASWGRFSVETWGCQMNVSDTEAMISSLSENYRLITDPELSDVIILNTCHIREKAYHKVVSRLGELQILKRQRPHLKIVVAGCVAQARGRAMLRELPVIDVLIGPGRLNELPHLLKQRQSGAPPQLALGFPRVKSGALKPETHDFSQLVHPGKNQISRFITIQQGCNNYCTFCVVPHTRGPEISVPHDEVLKRIKLMIDGGVKEITLLGQNVNSYGLDLLASGAEKQKILNGLRQTPFSRLLSAAIKIPGHWRLRFTTSNPHDLTDDIAPLFALAPETLGSYFHLPVQSGSDKMLARMKRKVTRQEYLDKVSRLREFVPEMSLSTDIIVGFPGESEEDFQLTCSLVEAVRFSFIYAFAYSPRSKTPAQRFSDHIPRAVQKRRLQELLQLQSKITQELASEQIGKVREVLFLYAAKKHPGAYYGRTEHYKLVKVLSPSDNLIGQFKHVLITGGNATALEGDLV